MTSFNLTIFFFTEYAISEVLFWLFFFSVWKKLKLAKLSSQRHCMKYCIPQWKELKCKITFLLLFHAALEFQKHLLGMTNFLASFAIHIHPYHLCFISSHYLHRHNTVDSYLKRRKKPGGPFFQDCLRMFNYYWSDKVSNGSVCVGAIHQDGEHSSVDLCPDSILFSAFKGAICKNLHVLKG